MCIYLWEKEKCILFMSFMRALPLWRHSRALASVRGRSEQSEVFILFDPDQKRVKREIISNGLICVCLPCENELHVWVAFS